MLYVFRGGRKNLWSISSCIVGEFLSFLDLSLSLMGFDWVQHSNVKDVVVACRRMTTKSWILGVWNRFVWLFGGLLGRREIDIFWRAKLYCFKIVTSIF